MVKSTDLALILVTILFPPAAAAIITGCSMDLLINILLTVLGYIPGHIHGFWLIYKRAQAEERFGPHGYKYTGNGEFISTSGPTGGHYAHLGGTNAGSGQQQQQQQQQPLHSSQPPAYGATK